MRPLAIAIVGCGSFGSKMATRISELPAFRIVAFCDPIPELAESLHRTFGAPAFTSLDQVLNDVRVEAVALFTPNFLHCEQTIAAARAGRHIFCEKPMAMDLEQCEAMIDAAERARVRLTVGHKRKLRPQYRYMAKRVRSLELGRILSVNINGFFGRQAQSWWRVRKTGGGLLPYAGVHDIDFLRHICGEAASVFARTPIKMDHHTDFEDAISLLIHFETGPVAALQVCPLSPSVPFRESFSVHIVLERGSIFYDPTRTTVATRHPDGREEIVQFDNEAGFREAYIQEFNSFAEWVQTGTPPAVTAEDGLRNVEIMQAAQRSAYSGKEVEIPLARPVTRIDDPPAVLHVGGLSMPEGPAFGPDGSLYVANCRSDFVSRVRGGKTERAWVTGGKTQGVAIGRDGSTYISDHSRKAIFRGAADLTVEVWCDEYCDGSPLRGPNEIAIGPNGDVYFSDPGTAWRGRATGAFSRVREDRTAELLADGLEFTNGFDFAPCGEEVYLVETTTGRILRASMKIGGELAEPFTEFARFSGRLGPDGVRIARSGNLYITLFGSGSIAVLAPDGREIRRITLPGLFPTNCIFQGTTLLVCEGQTGAIWQVDVGEEGIPPWTNREAQMHS